MNKNNSLIVQKEGIFSKILKKIKSLFFKNKCKNNIDTIPNNIIKPNFKANSFFSNIKVDVDFEIQQLKVKLDNGDIQAIDLTDEQIDKLQKIYDKEVAEKKLKLQNLKKRA